MSQLTDNEAIDQVLAMMDPAPRSLSSIRKNHRLLLALPRSGAAARRALQLYQPQRLKARATMALVRGAALAGLHYFLLPKIKSRSVEIPLDPAFPEVEPGSVGIMLGSPEHRVRRAIVSYQTAEGWEVAKVALGPEGAGVIAGETAALKSLPRGTSGAPRLLGIHHGADIAVMRMPYFQGRVIQQGDAADAITLLKSWVSAEPPRALTCFPEWASIESALSGHPNGSKVLEKLSRLQIKPVIRHGDFARWNLLRMKDGKLMVLDWEWGVGTGMAGIDLVHFFAQDARLVRGLAPAEVIRSAARSLERPDCREYLEQTGWGGEAMLAILASIGFTVGARQQANEEVMEAALEAV